MPNQREDTIGKSASPGPENIISNFPNVTITTKPVFICGVNRKLSIGNFENIDIYSGLALPVDVDPNDLEALREVISAIAEYGFQLVSKETGDRYRLIKEGL